MLGSALYYPHIDIYDGQWLRTAVLFWDEIKTIAPKAISKPYQNSDTKLLWQEGFLEPLRCDLHPELLDTLGKRVVSLMDGSWLQNEANLDEAGIDPNSMAMMHADKAGNRVRDQFLNAQIHPEKMSAELRDLVMRSGLARMHPSKLAPELRELFQEIEFANIYPDKLTLHLLHEGYQKI